MGLTASYNLQEPKGGSIAWPHMCHVACYLHLSWGSHKAEM
jgi:hypothetical protein